MNENFEENPNPSTLENLNNPSPYENRESQYTPPAPRKRSPKKFLYIIGAVIAVFVLLNVVRFISSKISKPTPTPVPTPTVSLETPNPTPSESPSPTPSASPTATSKPSVNSVDSATGLDRAKLSVEVQNGSGTAGAAGKAADFLKSLGYDVVSTGNADNFDYTNVTIKVKSSEQSYLPLLNKDLSANYSVGTTSSDLSATSSADALVIIGK